MTVEGSGRFAGRTAVVTGGSRGIGRDIVELLAAHGATVVSLDINPPDGEPYPAHSILADVSSEHDVDQAFAAIHRDLGPTRILVNNAGLFSTLDRRPFWELTVDEWDRVSSVNVRSVFLCARAAAGPMREARNGRIVNLGSTSSTIGMGGLLHYVTSKAAIIGMTRGLARELGPDGVTVNAVAPGLVTTELTRETISHDYRNRIAQTQLITEPITGADIAEAVVYLCSDGARLVTGQTVFVNGGASMSAA